LSLCRRLGHAPTEPSPSPGTPCMFRYGSDLRPDSVITYLTQHSAAESGARPALMSLYDMGR